MRIQSPLSSLCDTIEQVLVAASQYENILRKNEAATRAVLIDPILRGLGWDTANTSMVEVERKYGDSIVDYALCDTNGDVVVIVEAKAAEMKLTDQMSLTLVHYAFQFGTKRLFLTDGLVWKHFRDFAPGDVKPEHTIDLRHDSVVDAAAYLVQRLDAAIFWPERETADKLTQKINQLESDLATLKLALAAWPTPAAVQTPGSTAQSAAPRSAAQIDVMGLYFVDLGKVQDVKGKKPQALRLPDGATIKVTKWSEVLRECCKWALNAYPAMPLPLVDGAGRTVELLRYNQPPSGINYVAEQHMGQTIYIYTNYDANHSIANARHVLEQVPASLKNVKAGVAIVKG